MGLSILDVDLLAFEQGTASQQEAVVEGVMRSLGTGFVVTRCDLPIALLDEAYGRLGVFFALDEAR
ncbi:MAG: isopenicillin N synthase family oxygenase, partial [Cyanobacteriota bacterium]|nr:isopenicillin N synthase family oxygenase [Cyanobacteriota bacterium]